MQQVRFEWQENGRVHQQTLTVKPRALIGRLHNCDLVLHDLTISKYHAQVYCQNETLYIHNLSQVNAVWVNGIPIQQNQVLPLTVGATVQMGRVRLTLHAPPPIRQPSFQLQCSNCKKAVNGHEHKDCPHCGFNLASAQTFIFGRTQ